MAHPEDPFLPVPCSGFSLLAQTMLNLQSVPTQS